MTPLDRLRVSAQGLRSLVQKKGYGRASISADIRRFYHHGPSSGPMAGRKMHLRQAVAVALRVASKGAKKAAKRASKAGKEPSKQVQSLLRGERKLKRNPDRKRTVPVQFDKG